MAFTGFSARALDFYARLEADNTREFWTAHRSVYETEVRDPVRALVEALEPEFGAGKLFRPYRDQRFGRAESPYKTAQGAIVGPAPGIGWYVQIDADGLMVGGGFRAHGTAQTQRYRDAVDDDSSGVPLSRIVDTLRETGFEMEGDPLKTRPRGIGADHPRLELMRFRSLLAIMRYDDPPWLSSPAAMDHVREAWRALKPLNDWILANVGSGPPERR